MWGPGRRRGQLCHRLNRSGSMRTESWPLGRGPLWGHCELEKGSFRGVWVKSAWNWLKGESGREVIATEYGQLLRAFSWRKMRQSWDKERCLFSGWKLTALYRLIGKTQ